MIKGIFAAVIVFVSVINAQGQIRAKAISYKVEVDVDILNSGFDNDGPRYLNFEVDAYYTDTKLKTVVRKVGKHPDQGVTIRQRYYELNSLDEYNIDATQQYILFKKNQVVKMKSTGQQKDILGYKCREFTFKDYRGIDISLWVTDKLPKNICPLGNYSIKGTALEMKTSNGLTYIATDFAEGELDSTFFDIPQGFQQEELLVSQEEKKSR